MNVLRNYTRWRRSADQKLLHADILGAKMPITVDPTSREIVVCRCGTHLTPDEARMYGVRLIDAAVLADGASAIRE